MTARQEAIASAVAAHGWVGAPLNRCLCGHARGYDYHAARKEHDAHLAAAIAAAVDTVVEAERAEVESLRRWKAEAMEVMDGLDEVGRALGLPLGERITGRAAVDAALDLRNQAQQRAEVLAAVEALTWSPPAHDAVSGRPIPPRRKTHVRVRDLAAALAPTADHPAPGT